MREESLVPSAVGRADPARFAVDWQTQPVDRRTETAGSSAPEGDAATPAAADPDAWVGEWAFR